MEKIPSITPGENLLEVSFIPMRIMKSVGLRISEVITLKTGDIDIDIDRSVITVRQGLKNYHVQPSKTIERMANQYTMACQPGMYIRIILEIPGFSSSRTIGIYNHIFRKYL